MNLKNNKIRESIQNLDYFGVYMNFQFKDKEKYKSFFGGICFLIYFVFSISYILLNFNNFSQRKQLSLIYNEWVELEAQPINFSNFTTGIAIGLSMADPTKMSTLYEYMEIQFVGITYTKFNGTSSKNKLNIKLEKCEKHHFYNQVDYSFEVLGISNFFCPNMTDFQIQGIFTDEIFKYFEFTVTAKKTANKEVLKNLILENEIKAIIYFTERAFKVYDFDNPIQSFINTKFSVIDFDFYKKLNLDFMFQNFISDENYFFLTNYLQSYILLLEIQEYFSFVGRDRFEGGHRDSEVFCKLYLRCSTKVRLTKRIYLKLTEYLANMSSILSSILIIMLVVITNINLFKARQDLIQQILYFKDDNIFKVDINLKYLKDKFKNDCKIIFKLFIYSG